MYNIGHFLWFLPNKPKLYPNYPQCFKYENLKGKIKFILFYIDSRGVVGGNGNIRQCIGTRSKSVYTCEDVLGLHQNLD